MMELLLFQSKNKVTIDFVIFNLSLRVFCRPSEWMNAFLEQVIHHRISEEFSHFLFLKYPRNVEYSPVTMATEVIGVCVVRMAGNTACEHMGESFILFASVKHRKRIQLKVFYEVMICVYRCSFTCPNKYVPFLCTLSLCMWFCVILWNVNTALLFYLTFLEYCIN